MITKRHLRKTITICLLFICALFVMSSGVMAQDTVIVDDRSGEGHVDTLQEAIEIVNDNGEIIIRESQDVTSPYEGAKIGKGDDILDDGKSITIKGESDGIVVIESPDNQDAAIEVEDNDGRDINIENIMFSDSSHAIEAKSGSSVIVEDIAISSTITDTPFVLNDNIQGANGLDGATIKDNGVYYHPEQSTLTEDIVEAQNGDLITETIGVEPTGLIYEQAEDILSYNPVMTNNLDGVIEVGSANNLDSSDDYDITTPFYSLQAAVNYASSDSIIHVYPRNEPYEEVEFTGEGTTGLNDITIRGQSDRNSALPQVEGFQGNYPGEYNIRDIQITNEIIVDSDNVDLDVSENYWLSIDGPDESQTTVTTGTASDIITEPYCVDDRCQSDFSYSNLNKCINIESRNSNGNTIDSSSYGCDEFNDEVSVIIDEFINLEDTSRMELYNFDYTDFRESDVEVRTDTNQEVDVDINIISSDSSPDSEINVPSEDNFASGTIEAQYSTLLDTLEENEIIDVSPRAYVTINNNPPFVIELDRLRLEGMGDNVDVVREPDNIRQSSGQIQRSDFQGLTRNETTVVSRFNANEPDDLAFYDNLIPPTRTTDGETRDNTRGTVSYFDQLRTNPDRAAIIRPENPLRVGMSVDGISEAQAHIVEITYAIQGEDNPRNNIDVNFVDERSSEIYSGRTDDEKQLEVTSTSDEPFSDSGDTEDLETKTKEIPLHSSEVDFVNENGELYIVFENDDIDEDTVLLLYNVEVNTTDEVSEIDDETSEEGEESVATNPDERPGGFTVSFDVDGNMNTEYNTYDVEPNEELSSTVIFENTGDTTIDGEFAIIDTYETPDKRFPNEDDIDINVESRDEELERFNLRVAGGDTQTLSISNSWDESEFGNHTVKFVEIDEDGEYRNINEEEGQTPQYDAYVFQQATFEVENIDVPEEHMTHDNFNTDVTVHNIGDLSGERTVNVQFGEWESERTFELGGGDARADETSEETTLRFARDIHPESGGSMDFTFREYTTPEDVVSHMYTGYSGPFETSDEAPLFYDEDTHNNYRPDAPFGLEEGEDQYEVTISNQFEGDIFPDIEQLLISEKESTINLHNVIISDLNIVTESGQITQRPTEDDSIYASAYPYVHPSYGTQSSSVMGETHVQSNDVRGGLGTMFSYNDENRNVEMNRGATPLNLIGIDSVTQPDNRYFSIYHSHQNRYCNPNLLDDESVQVSEDEADESDTEVFLPYSADGELEDELCADEDRFVSLQLPRFVDSTDANTEETQNVPHPDGEFNIQGVNQDNFEQLEDDESIMYALATLSNPSSNQPATARFEIKSDRELNTRGYSVGLGEAGDHQINLGDDSFEDNVVGVGAVELSPEETQEIKVPIIIKNDEGNDGVHTLSIHPRDDDDYIRRTEDVTPPNNMERSELTGDYHSQFEVPINVETYGDAIIESLEPTDNNQGTGDDPEDAQNADVAVNQICTSNADEALDNRDVFWVTNDNTVSPDVVEGLNPLSGVMNSLGVVRDVGTCNTDEPTSETVAEFETDYTNYGGETIEIQPEALTEFESREYMTELHKMNAQLTGDRLVAGQEDNPDVGTNAEINAMYDVDGQEIDFDEHIEIEPGETRTFTFSRVFQEPGLHHVRHSPCRAITEDGPQHYQLSGFTGIVDSVDAPNAVGDRNTWIQNHDRANSPGSYNVLTTNDVGQSAFHGAKGCDDVVSSVFVYDITEPVADFRITESESATKLIDDTIVQTRLQDQTPENSLDADETYGDKTTDFEVYEGGMLFLDGSTQDCPNCYDSDVFTPDNQADVTDWNNRQELSENNLKMHRMSQTNTILTDMLWQINGEEPNYGDDNVCTHVSQNSIDEHCYMEVLNAQDDYEVTSHRFTNPGEDTIRLQVWDDTRFTEGEPNTNVTEHTVSVEEDNEDPIVETDHSLHNDLDYDRQTDATSDSTLWHRVENVFNDVDYRNTPSNFDRDYGDTYEGTRMCMSVIESEDNQIGISQDSWWQVNGGTQEYMDNGVLVVDDGTYNERTGETSDARINPWHLQTDLSETRDGDRRCWIFDEEDDSGSNERQHTFEYEAWDFADNSETDSESVDVVRDDIIPAVDEHSASYDTATGDSTGGTDNGWVWAHNMNRDFAGDDVQFNVAGIDADMGVGIACVDVRLNVGSGPSYNGEDIHDNCQSMGDMAGETPEFQGTHGNDATDGASATVGSSQTPDIYSSNNYFSSSELGDDYALPSEDPNGDDTFTVEEEVHVVDWHGNEMSDTIEVDVRVDGTDPRLSGSYSCSGSSCGTDTVDFDSRGPDGGTYIVDAEVVSVSGGEDSCTISGDDSGSSCSYSGTSAEVVDFDYQQFSGEIEIDVDSSIDADASVSSASASCSGCGDSDTDRTSVDVDADASGEMTVEITDAHGNTDRETYDWSISDSDSDSDRDRCSNDPCDDDDGD